MSPQDDCDHYMSTKECVHESDNTVCKQEIRLVHQIREIKSGTGDYFRYKSVAIYHAKRRQYLTGESTVNRGQFLSQHILHFNSYSVIMT